MSRASKGGSSAEEGDVDSPRGRGGRSAPPVLPSLLWDLTRAQLLAPALAEDLVHFSMLSVGPRCRRWEWACAERGGTLWFSFSGGYMVGEDQPLSGHHIQGYGALIGFWGLLWRRRASASALGFDIAPYPPPCARSWHGCKTCSPRARSNHSPTFPSTPCPGRSPGSSL